MRYVGDDDDEELPFVVSHTRRSDPETSYEAAGSVGDPRMTQLAVLSVLKAVGPCTDEQLVSAYLLSRQRRQSPSGIRTRRAELVAAGLVEFTGETAVMKTGRRGRVWRATSEERRMA